VVIDKVNDGGISKYLLITLEGIIVMVKSFNLRFFNRENMRENLHRIAMKQNISTNRLILNTLDDLIEVENMKRTKFDRIVNMNYDYGKKTYISFIFLSIFVLATIPLINKGSWYLVIVTISIVGICLTLIFLSIYVISTVLMMHRPSILIKKIGNLQRALEFNKDYIDEVDCKNGYFYCIKKRLSTHFATSQTDKKIYFFNYINKEQLFTHSITFPIETTNFAHFGIYFFAGLS
jgi:hypothetical protein